MLVVTLSSSVKRQVCFQTSLHPFCPRRSWLQRLQHNRSAAAALKLWLGMSGLVVLFILVAENPGGTIHPTVAYAVMTVPTHGVIALVLAWHERVESTFIRVSQAGRGVCGAKGGGAVDGQAAAARRGVCCALFRPKQCMVVLRIVFGELRGIIHNR